MTAKNEDAWRKRWSSLQEAPPGLAKRFVRNSISEFTQNKTKIMLLNQKLKYQYLYNNAIYR